MGKDWSYAKMSQAAANAGGPDNWIDTINRTAYSSGVSDTKVKLVIPLLTVGIGMGTAGTIAYQKIKKWLAEKREETLIIEQDAVKAEQFLKKDLADTVEEIENDAGGSVE